MLLKQVFEQGFIADIAFDENRCAATDLFNPLDDTDIAVTQIVQHDHIMSCLQQGYAGMRANKPRAARDKY